MIAPARRSAYSESMNDKEFAEHYANKPIAYSVTETSNGRFAVVCGVQHLGVVTKFYKTSVDPVITWHRLHVFILRDKAVAQAKTEAEAEGLPFVDATWKVEPRPINEQPRQYTPF